MTPPLRTHQTRALQALDEVWEGGRHRAWVVLPPGAGKTRVGLETITSTLAVAPRTQVVVLSPNTAIQAQWVAAAGSHGLEAGTGRELDRPVACLTYQSLAVFDADDEVSDDPEEPPAQPAADRPGRNDRGQLLDRLHPNGARLVSALQECPRLLLVLDECHHLLEVWGRLLADLLHTVEDARVLGLTATPPDALTGEQSELVAELFGDVAFSAGVPAVVKEGHLAPFAELAWLTTPTEQESDWLRSEAVRWDELVTHLLDPTFATVPFLSWVQARFVDPVPQVHSWAALARSEPDLTDAALRLVHAGLMPLPEGARLVEQHRRDPDAEDWVDLLDDWVGTHLRPSEHPDDVAALEAVRTALPSVGYVLTRRGIRRGRTPVDRVLARSVSKTTAAVEIVSHEQRLLGDRARLLVLCDHERASATLPTGLQGVIDTQSGSAYAALEALVRDPATAALSPLLVTGRTVAGAPPTLQALADHVGEHHPHLRGRLTVRTDGGGEGDVATLDGPWSSRSWVRPVTTFFEAGHSQVLVGTRGLLGEGWDARRITGLIDLTTATTLTAVVQTRGRALRTDPHWPDKVAVNWTVTCVTDAHPKGGTDWARLVRKHQGFHGVDDDGDIVDGVSHIDPAFSPYAPPPTDELAQINARMLRRAGERDEIRARWRVGEPYRDEVAATIRITGRRPYAVPAAAVLPGTVGGVSRLRLVPPAVVQGRDEIQLRAPEAGPPALGAMPDVGAITVATAGVATAASYPVIGWWATAGVVLTAAGATGIRARLQDRAEELGGWVRDTVAAASATPSIGQVAAAVADGLLDADLTAAGADRVLVEIHPGGEHRCRLDASPQDAEVFAAALDEALAPVTAPRYVISRYTRTGAPDLGPAGRVHTRVSAFDAVLRQRSDGAAWHPVPSVLGANAGRARHYLRAWSEWVGEGELLFTGSPEGAGVLAAQRGADPFQAATVIRRHWV